MMPSDDDASSESEAKCEDDLFLGCTGLLLGKLQYKQENHLRKK